MTVVIHAMATLHMTMHVLRTITIATMLTSAHPHTVTATSCAEPLVRRHHRVDNPLVRSSCGRPTEHAGRAINGLCYDNDCINHVDVAQVAAAASAVTADTHAAAH